MKGKTTLLFLIAFVLAFAVLAAAQGGNAPNGFGGGGFGKGGFGKGGGGFGGGGDGKNNDGKNNDGKNNDGKNNDGKNNDGFDGGDGKNGKINDGFDGGDGKNGGDNNNNAQICNNGKFGIADGTQNPDQSTCVTTQMGQLPTFDNMVASMIVSPQDRSTVQANTPFQVQVAVANMETGFFSDADTQYYTESQQLNAQGFVQGHSHITIQQVQPKQAQPADARAFAFFEGLNDPAKNGILETTVPGLAKGFYRACTMTSSFTHQPVLMPVAKRGAQDDCIRFTVL